MRTSFVLLISLSIACGGGDGGGGSGSCSNSCDVAGSTRCSGAQVQTCQAAANGCLAWSAAAACAGGACNPATNTCCTDACAAGAKQCSGAQVQTCERAATGCLAWSAPAACPATQVCSESGHGCVSDPCNGVPASGVCASPTSVSVCATPTGEATPRVQTYSCAEGETCQIKDGKAQCVLTSACVSGSTECVNATTLRTCAGGNWTQTACPATCRTSALGAFCAAPGALKAFSGTVLFEARAPNDTMTDWTDQPKRYYAPLFLVLSQGPNKAMYDAVYTSAVQGQYGQFTIEVPQSPGPDDRVVVAAAADDGLGGLSFAVVSPGFSSAGEHAIGDVGTPALWSWAWKTTELVEGQQLVVTEDMGSGAANVHFNLLVAYAKAYQEYSRIGPPLVVWIGSGATWSCGGCFADYPTTVFGMRFDGQIWLGADAEDQAYWSDAVNSHELGHWAMSSFGRNPGEGGRHFLMKPTFPGQAWSEGWATFFSSDVRDNPIYYDKQRGSFFWVNIGSEKYSNGGSFVTPKAADGLFQLLDENEVSSILWNLRKTSAAAEAAIFASVASPRMTTAPVTRGYTRHTWDYDANRNVINVVDTREPSLCIADFLDGLDCAGFSRSSIDAVTLPATEYPYPSANPLCP